MEILIFKEFIIVTRERKALSFYCSVYLYYNGHFVTREIPSKKKFEKIFMSGGLYGEFISNYTILSCRKTNFLVKRIL